MRTRFFIFASVCVAATIALVFAVRMQGSKPQAIQVASPPYLIRLRTTLTITRI
jgi:hypothetical protein